MMNNVFIIIAFIAASACALQCGTVQHETMNTYEVGKNSNGQVEVYPWHVLIRRESHMKIDCIGSLIPRIGSENSSDLVLTAESCFNSLFDKRSSNKYAHYVAYVGVTHRRLGQTDGRKIKIKYGVAFGQENGSEAVKQGVAIVKLKKAAIFGKTVQPICIPDHVFAPIFFSKCFVPVYYTGSHRVDEVDSKIEFPRECREKIPILEGATGNCAEYTVTTQSKVKGSPLICIINHQAYHNGVLVDEFEMQDKHDGLKISTGFFVDAASYYKIYEQEEAKIIAEESISSESSSEQFV